jgi:hypothetical protein
MKALLIGVITILMLKSVFAADQSWQTTLRHELDVAAGTNHFCFISFVSTGSVHYTVPAEAAKLLASQSPTELLSFLSELRAASSPLAASIVDDWIRVVRCGLRGKASVRTITTTSTNKVVISKRDVPVFEYSMSMFEKNDDPKKP